MTSRRRSKKIVWEDEYVEAVSSALIWWSSLGCSMGWLNCAEYKVKKVDSKWYLVGRSKTVGRVAKLWLEVLAEKDLGDCR